MVVKIILKIACCVFPQFSICIFNFPTKIFLIMNKSVLLLLQSPWGDEMKQASARKNRVLKSVVANMSCMYIYLMLSVIGG